MTNDDKKRIYKELAAPFSDEAIQRTEGRVTGRGYDTTGYGYQFIVNRLNEVLAIGGWRTDQKITVREGTTAKGRTTFDATCDLTLQFGEWVDGVFKPWAEAHATGGHTSLLEADARKGAYTNALKKAAAMLGCGKQAFEGSIDDDNAPGIGVDDTAFPPPEFQEPPHRPAQNRPPENPPAETRQPPKGQTPNVGSGPAPANTRLRLSSKQLGAIWAMARKLGHEQSAFRKVIRERYGVQPEFLDKQTASTIIEQMSARLSNGASHPTGNVADPGAGAAA